MTSPIIPSRPFDHPAAWTAGDLGSKDAFDLTDRHIAAFEAPVPGLRERGLTAFEDIGRHDFSLGSIAEGCPGVAPRGGQRPRAPAPAGVPDGSMEPGGDGAGVVRPRHSFRPGGVAERTRGPAGVDCGKG